MTDSNAVTDKTKAPNAVIVGGGFAGVGCAADLAKSGVEVTLIDQNNYHQFQPMLYQVATAQVASSDIAAPLRGIFSRHPSVHVKLGTVTTIDPSTKTVVVRDGETFVADYLVLAMGTQPNFFRTPGATEHAFPLYSVPNAQQLRSRIFEAFEEADVDPSRIEKGALNFVIVGGGATGVETAGALADLINNVMPGRYHSLPIHEAKVYIVDPAPVLLAPFSDKAHDYTAKVLTREGVQLKLGLSVKEVHPDRVVLSDGSEIVTRTVIWAAGVQASPLASSIGLPTGRGGRIVVDHDLTVAGFPGVYSAGDVAAIPSPDGQTTFPQLGSVALQSGRWAAQNILADVAGKPHTAFHYKDKGIMAMIGRKAAVAEMGEHRHEMHGGIAFAAWLGVHAWLLTGIRQRIDAFMSWGWDYFSSSRGPADIDEPDKARIDWGDDDRPGAGDIPVDGEGQPAVGGTSDPVASGAKPPQS